MTECLPIFSKGVRPGVIRYWHFEVDGDKWRGHYGIVGGKDAVSGWSTATTKNAGKANERGPEEQAKAEAIAEHDKKLDRDYRRTVEELDSVPPAVMLAADYNKLKKPLLFNPRGVWAQPKLDGIRLTGSRLGGFSREFQPFYTVDHIMAELEPAFKAYPDLITDGELYNHALRADFNKISSLVRKKTLTSGEREDVERLLEYHIYDLPSVDGGFQFRHGAVKSLFDEFKLDMTAIVMVPTVDVGTLAALEEARNVWLDQGYEGLMVRLDGEPYEFGVRSKQLMKHKADKITEEFPVSKLIEGNGNWAGYAKAVEFVLPGDVRNKKGERPKAGIKGDQEFTKELLTRDPAPTYVTVEYFGKTPDGQCRFPVAVDWHVGERKD
jgi:DNA ligase-1